MTITVLRPLTERQARIWRYIRDYSVEHRQGCGYRQLCNHFAWKSPHAAQFHVASMARKGWVEATPGRANSILPTLESLEATDGEVQ